MATPATTWRCGAYELDLGRCRVMGVLNVTPDSFSDGGLHADPEAAIEWGLRLLDEGADVVDVGGESTRPGFTPVDEAEEIARVVPVVTALCGAGACVSIDTRHAAVAAAALEAGASIVNDVSGFEDPAMVEVAAASGCGLVAMHSASGFLSGKTLVGIDVPRDLDEFARYVELYLARRLEALVAAGIDPARVALDPGPGFGTVPDQDVAVQRATARLVASGQPILCAPSRKRFVGALSGEGRSECRDAATAGVCCAAAAAGARVFRVHDVRGCSGALRGFEACAGIAPERRAFVALGSNMGERLANIAAALQALEAVAQTRVVAASRVFETRPAYFGDQDLFANAVVEVATRLHPRSLLEALLRIEDEAGRVRVFTNGPRVLDVDLLWMEGERHAGSRLALPHPLMGERDFVLVPLADLVGDAEAFCARSGIAVGAPGERVGAIARVLSPAPPLPGIS